MGDEFAEDKLILFVKPSEGYGFSSYSWAGLTGVVSGMNEKGLTVTLNASKSEIPTGAKNPISLLAREILQYAANINEAIAIAEKRSVFVSESLLIGSAEDDKSVVIEKSPEKMDVYDANEELVVCANHYQGSVFLNDSANVLNIKNSDSKYRFDRLTELLQQNYPIDILKATQILRDKKGIDDAFIGYGNPKAINQLIAHHSIVFKPHQRQFWISTQPYQLGHFIGYNLTDVLTKKNSSDNTYIDSLTIAPDDFLKSDAYKKYEIFKKIKQRIQKLVLLDIPFSLNDTQEKQFIQTNPDSYITFMTLGDYHEKRGNFDKAIAYYKMALTQSVASKDEEEIIKKKIETCQKQLNKNGN